jgi:aquaporin Z
MRAASSHWPEYVIEAVGLGTFMLSACSFGTLLTHPASPLAGRVAHPLTMRALMGAAMGLTGLALVLSPWGKRSGGHFNPAVTLTFYRLGKIAPADAAAYVIAQFVGGAVGVLVAATALRSMLAHPAVRYVVTAGTYGEATAFAGELLISFGLMTAVLVVSNVPALNRFTPFVAAALVALYITFEAPLSGTSMNPARTLASALPARFWDALWIYFVAPPLGMLAAAECYLRLGSRVLCAKLHHVNDQPCIFRCAFPGEGRS